MGGRTKIGPDWIMKYREKWVLVGVDVGIRAPTLINATHCHVTYTRSPLCWSSGLILGICQLIVDGHNFIPPPSQILALGRHLAHHVPTSIAGPIQPHRPHDLVERRWDRG